MSTWCHQALMWPDQLDLQIKDQWGKTLLYTIFPAQYWNFVTCGRDKPSHMTQNFIIAGKIVDRTMISNWSLIYGSSWSGLIKAASSLSWYWQWLAGAGLSCEKPVTWPGARFTNSFSIAIQIRWKFCFTLTSILIAWWLSKFCTWHDSCAVVACAKICCDLMASNGITIRRSFHRIWTAGKKSLVKRAPVPLLWLYSIPKNHLHCCAFL